jgi:hypothetical protein
MGQFSVDRKPSRILSLYVPAALGLVTALSTDWMCLCSVAERVFLTLMTAVVAFGVWWLLLTVGFYGYHFVRRLFQHRP